jgi:hypothetical protein
MLSQPGIFLICMDMWRSKMPVTSQLHIKKVLNDGHFSLILPCQTYSLLRPCQRLPGSARIIYLNIPSLICHCICINLVSLQSHSVDLFDLTKLLASWNMEWGLLKAWHWQRHPTLELFWHNTDHSYYLQLTSASRSADIMMQHQFPVVIRSLTANLLLLPFQVSTHFHPQESPSASVAAA